MKHSQEKLVIELLINMLTIAFPTKEVIVANDVLTKVDTEVAGSYLVLDIVGSIINYAGVMLENGTFAGENDTYAVALNKLADSFKELAVSTVSDSNSVELKAIDLIVEHTKDLSLRYKTHSVDNKVDLSDESIEDAFKRIVGNK